jgi:predicted ATP-binding protein involved in virulence
MAIGFPISNQKIHEAVYLYLKDNNFRFIVRQRPTEKLEKGFWLLGNDNVVVTSFWEGRDWQNKTPYIYLDIFEDKLVLNFISNIDSDRQEKLGVLASFLDMKQVIRKSGEIPHWVKEYNLSKDDDSYIDLLTKFVNGDKIRIDKFLSQKEVKTLFPIIEENEFKINIIRIEEYRKKFRNKSQHNISAANESSVASQPQYIINSLDCENIGHFTQFTERSIQLRKRITCLIGENGSGKSTILRCIAAAIATYDRNDKSYEINSALKYMLKLKGIDANGNLIHEDNGCIKLSYEKTEGNKKSVHSNGLIFDSKGQYFISDDSNCDFEINDNQNYKTLILGFAQTRGDIDNKELNTNRKPNLDDIKNLINGEGGINVSFLQDWLLKLRATGLEQEAKKEKNIKEFKIIDTVFELVNKIIAESEGQITIKVKDFYHNKSFIGVNISGQEVPFSIMSQGFNNVFLWVGQLIKRLSEVYPNSTDFAQEPCICLIDEIDTYLHPDWQYTILGTLSEYFGKTQFIVTTHSPYVLGGIKSNDVLIYEFYKNEKNIIVIDKIEDNLYGASVEYLTTIMRSTRRNPPITVKFKELYQSIKEKNVLKANELITELSKIIDKDDPDLIKAQLLLQQ